MKCVWVGLGFVILVLLFLVIYLLDHWQKLDSKQRESIFCNILTTACLAIMIWSMIETNQKIEQMQQQPIKDESSRVRNSVLEDYEDELSPKILIRTNQENMDKLRIHGVKEGTKIFFEYDGKK